MAQKSAAVEVRWIDELYRRTRTQFVALQKEGQAFQREAEEKARQQMDEIRSILESTIQQVQTSANMQQSVQDTISKTDSFREDVLQITEKQSKDIEMIQENLSSCLLVKEIRNILETTVQQVQTSANMQQSVQDTISKNDSFREDVLQITEKQSKDIEMIQENLSSCFLVNSTIRDSIDLLTKTLSGCFKQNEMKLKALTEHVVQIPTRGQIVEMTHESVSKTLDEKMTTLGDDMKQNTSKRFGEFETTLVTMSADTQQLLNSCFKDTEINFKTLTEQMATLHSQITIPTQSPTQSQEMITLCDEMKDSTSKQLGEFETNLITMSADTQHLLNSCFKENEIKFKKLSEQIVDLHSHMTARTQSPAQSQFVEMIQEIMSKTLDEKMTKLCDEVQDRTSKQLVELETNFTKTSVDTRQLLNSCFKDNEIKLKALTEQMPNLHSQMTSRTLKTLAEQSASKTLDEKMKTLCDEMKDSTSKQFSEFEANSARMSVDTQSQMVEMIQKGVSKTLDEKMTPLCDVVKDITSKQFGKFAINLKNSAEQIRNVNSQGPMQGQIAEMIQESVSKTLDEKMAGLRDDMKDSTSKQFGEFATELATNLQRVSDEVCDDFATKSVDTSHFLQVNEIRLKTLNEQMANLHSQITAQVMALGGTTSPMVDMQLNMSKTLDEKMTSLRDEIKDSTLKQIGEKIRSANDGPMKMNLNEILRVTIVWTAGVMAKADREQTDNWSFQLARRACGYLCGVRHSKADDNIKEMRSMSSLIDTKVKELMSECNDWKNVKQRFRQKKQNEWETFQRRFPTSDSPYSIVFDQPMALNQPTALGLPDSNGSREREQEGGREGGDDIQDAVEDLHEILIHAVQAAMARTFYDQVNRRIMPALKYLQAEVVLVLAMISFVLILTGVG